MTFSITDVTYEGFRLTRRKPLAVLTWAALIAAIYGVFLLAAGPWLLVMVQEMKALEGVTQPTPDQLTLAAQASGMILAYSTPLLVIGAAIFSSALVRAVLKPEDSRRAYLALGRDEIRVLVVKAVMALGFSLISMVSFTLVGVLLGLATAVPALGLVAFLASVAAVAVMFWLALRLSLAVPATMAEGRIGLATSFRMTKGHSVRLLGVALLSLMYALLVTLLLSMALSPLGMVSAGGATADPVERVQQMLAQGPIGLVIPAIMNGLLITAQFSLLYAPFAAVYQRLKGTV